MPNLKKQLPDDICWLTETVELLVRPAARFYSLKGAIAPVGRSFMHGAPDIPVDAPWAAKMPAEDLQQSPYDGPSHWLQLNLAEVPAVARRPEWPTAGLVWMFVDLTDNWEVLVYFDPRPVSEIAFHPRKQGVESRILELELQDTMCCGTPGTLPEISADEELCGLFDNWSQEHYASGGPASFQVGGWVWPCQGDFDAENKTLVAAFEQQEFGDSGAVYLHFSPERGFYGCAQTH